MIEYYRAPTTEETKSDDIPIEWVGGIKCTAIQATKKYIVKNGVRTEYRREKRGQKWQWYEARQI